MPVPGERAERPERLHPPGRDAGSVHRLVVRFDRERLARLGPPCRFEGVESLELTHLLRAGPDGVAGIFEMRLSGPDAAARELVGHGGFRRIEPVARYGERRVIFGETTGPPEILRALARRSLYLDAPIRLDDRCLTLGFLGSADVLRSFSRRLLADQVSHVVVALQEARAAFDSPLAALTPAQRSAARAAVARGFYAFPRRTDLAALAREAGVSKSAFAERLRAAERKLVEGAVGR